MDATAHHYFNNVDCEALDARPSSASPLRQADDARGHDAGMTLACAGSVWRAPSMLSASSSAACADRPDVHRRHAARVRADPPDSRRPGREPVRRARDGPGAARAPAARVRPRPPAAGPVRRIRRHRCCRGDLGTSLTTHEPVLQEFLTLFPATVELAFFALLFAVVIGLPAGIARRASSATPSPTTR